MHDGWEVTSLGDILDPKRPITYGVVQPGDHDPSGIPLVRGGDFSFGWRPVEEYRRVSPAIERAFARARLKPGDIVITIKGDVGTAAIVPGFLAGANLSQTNARLAINPGKAVPEYVLAFLRSSEGRRQIARVTQSGAQPGLIFRDILALQLRLPPLAEQKRITKALAEWDQAIITSEELLGATRKLKQGLKQRLLSPCLSEERPKTWTKLRLRDAFQERDERGEDLPLLSITAAGGVVDRATIERRDTSPVDKSLYKVIRPGDIGYNTMRMWQGVSGLSKLTGLVSPAYTVVTPLLGVAHPSFVAYLFKTPSMVHRFFRYSQGLVDDQLQLRFASFSEIAVNLPPLHEQEEAARLFDVIEARIDLLSKQIKALRCQKRGLLQKLLYGSWRVSGGAVPQAAE